MKFLELKFYNDGSPILINADLVTGIGKNTSGQMCIWYSGSDEPFAVRESYERIKYLLKYDCDAEVYPL